MVESKLHDEAKGESRGASFFVALGILLSRISGLVRDRVFAHYLGNSEAAGAFRAALRIPNFLQNLFGEGVLSASFIPVYTRLRAEMNDETARRMAGAVVSILAAMVSVMVLLGVTFAADFVDLVAPGFEGEVRAVTVRLVQVLFPGVGLLVLSAWCLGILNSHRKFFLSYFAPVLWNASMIGTLVLCGLMDEQYELVHDLAWGSVVGSFLQLAVQLPFVIKVAGNVKPIWAPRMKEVGEVLRGAVPVLISRGVVQLSAYIDGMIASFLGAGAVAGLAYAQTIYLLPVSLFGMSVAAAELPAMSEVGGDNPEAHERLRLRLVSGRRQIAFFVIPSVIVLSVLGRFVVMALYKTGKFTDDDSRYVWFILIGSVVGLLAATWGRLYSSAFYALRDTRTPLLFAIIRVVLTIVLGLLFAFPLRPYLIELFYLSSSFRAPHIESFHLAIGAVGLTASAGVAGWIEFLLLKRALELRIGKAVVPTLFIAKLWGCALFALGVALAFFWRFVRGKSLIVFHYDFLPLLVIAVFGGSYLLLTIALRIEETGPIRRRLLRR